MRNHHVCPRVLYLWEWGAGYGHLRRFRALAVELMRSGCDVVLAVKDRSRALEVFQGLSVGIVPVPELTAPRTGVCEKPHSFGGLAWNLGVNDLQRVSGAVAQWKGLLQAIKPTHVVADFGLLGAFVAEALQMPTSRIGTGFGTPPQQDVLASMFGQPLSPTELNLAQRLLETVQTAAVANALPVPADWNRLFEISGPTLLVSVPDFDPYRSCRGAEAYLGVWDQSGGCRPQWHGPGAKTIAYLKPSSKLKNQCGRLAALGLNVLLVCDGSNKELRALKDIAGVSLSPQLVGLDHCRRDCALIVCNANHGMTLKALSMGIPVAMFPLYIEQRWNSMVVERLALGIDLSSCPEAFWQKGIEDLCHSAEARKRLDAYAAYLERFDALALPNAVTILQHWIETPQ